MATYDELIAANHTVEEIREKTGADSLGYLSLDGLIRAVGRKREDMCLGCLIGEYPNAPEEHETRTLVKVDRPAANSARAASSLVPETRLRLEV
jgi:amidophosphoribosyltransferase